MKALLVPSLYLLLLLLALTSCSSLEETVKDPSGFKVEVRRYKGVRPVTGTILILPPTGGENFIDRSYGRMFARDGFDVIILKSWTDDYVQSLDVQMHEKRFDNALRAVKIVKAKFELKHFGVLGTSVGALYATMLVDELEDLDAAYAIVGGIPFSNVIAESTEEEMTLLRKKRVQPSALGSQENYVEALSQVITHSGGKRDHYSGIGLGVVLAQDDEKVPSYLQKNLVEAWKPDQVTTFDGGHLGTVFKMWMFHSNQVRDFFKKYLRSNFSNDATGYAGSPLSLRSEIGH